LCNGLIAIEDRGGIEPPQIPNYPMSDLRTSPFAKRVREI